MEILNKPLHFIFKENLLDQYFFQCNSGWFGWWFCGAQCRGAAVVTALTCPANVVRGQPPFAAHFLLNNKFTLAECYIFAVLGAHFKSRLGQAANIQLPTPQKHARTTN